MGAVLMLLAVLAALTARTACGTIHARIKDSEGRNVMRCRANSR